MNTHAPINAGADMEQISAAGRRMTEPIAEFCDYDGLVAGLRKRIAELGIPVERLDEIAGLATGYFSKIAGNRPVRRLGLKSLGDIFGALAIRGTLLEDAEQLARIKRNPNYRLRDDRLVRSKATHIVFTYQMIKEKWPQRRACSCK